jgi:hypothetical protein
MTHLKISMLVITQSFHPRAKETINLQREHFFYQLKECGLLHSYNLKEFAAGRVPEPETWVNFRRKIIFNKRFFFFFFF